MLPHRWRWILLLVASYAFYMSWNPAYIVLIGGSTLVDYVVAQIDAVSFRSYKSFDEDPEASRKEIHRMRDEGFLHFLDIILKSL